MNNPFTQVQQVNFLDIGCSGPLDSKWSDLAQLLAYTGFEPNASECRRLSREPHPYKSTRYLPFAISGEQGDRVMYKTHHPFCYSLLRPNHDWLGRFSHHYQFRETGTDTVSCMTLNSLANEQQLTADIIKLDTQGLELPILKAGNQVLQNAFCVETETGFVENYIGETTYTQLEAFMRSQGFLMFDMEIYQASRNNSLSKHGKHQPLWCEVVWLFDFVGTKKKTTPEQAIKYLKICQALEYFDYGLELAYYFKSLGIIEASTVKYLEKPEHWTNIERSDSWKKHKSLSKTGKVLSFLPNSINQRLTYGLKEVVEWGKK
ncbi:MAG: hypothetical protein CLLPBCKN_005544 [Chroococcidiopsis cubana SAG 39.79]|uniref:Methyltransferase FkbM family n=2 Tax=Chroococcidiopsis TaxID=54298 RepID=K9U6W3_CHRTP|nr:MULTISPECIES: FkbM family methyltransferase [Chroococcidiopsis]AFY89994.1 methyltransferase FkbM family [Chroococcidiopsis thermalis PCC 7203]MDZ4876124.1 hypothetical protein [Chroococcidiopsis cubana SAG 39.79]PSB64623.1 FkbM family methyltransferase [Chroococcidiopsis cubana CCALA 043]RUT13352.1 hypothetical protein DSM107010_13070 [Chroococcidiopsis cubana SAG 39.79]